MLGSMRRPSSSSLDCLEAERSASPKIPKSDTLSIYAEEQDHIHVADSLLEEQNRKDVAESTEEQLRRSSRGSKQPSWLKGFVQPSNIRKTTLQKLRLGSRRTFHLSSESSTTKEDKPEDRSLDSDCKPCRSQSMEENLSISNTVTGKQKQMNIKESMMSARMRI